MDVVSEDEDAGADVPVANTKRRRMVLEDDDDAPEAAKGGSEEDEPPSGTNHRLDTSRCTCLATAPQPKARSPRKPSSKPAVKVEGVGTLTMAAAAAHADFDLDKLAKWKAGQPVPFAFLADTFEAVAEESKRLAIINIMVGIVALTWFH